LVVTVKLFVTTVPVTVFMVTMPLFVVIVRPFVATVPLAELVVTMPSLDATSRLFVTMVPAAAFVDTVPSLVVTVRLFVVTVPAAPLLLGAVPPKARIAKLSNELPELSLIATLPPPPPLPLDPLVYEPPSAVMLPLPDIVPAVIFTDPPEPRAFPPLEAFAEIAPPTETLVAFTKIAPPARHGVPELPELPRLTGFIIEP
jgi:hypothetical protein